MAAKGLCASSVGTEIKENPRENQKKAPRQQLSEAPDLLDSQVPVTLSLTATHHKSPTPR